MNLFVLLETILSLFHPSIPKYVNTQNINRSTAFALTYGLKKYLDNTPEWQNIKIKKRKAYWSLTKP